MQIVWFEQLLRVADHPALVAAAAAGAVVPVVIEDPEVARGAAYRWWRHGALQVLGQELAGRGAPLVLRRGPAPATLVELARALGATTLHVTRTLDPAGLLQHARLDALATAAGLRVVRHEGWTMWPPEALHRGTGQPYQVFTPFMRACLARSLAPPLAAPTRLQGVAVPSLTLAELGLRSGAERMAGWTWRPGEAAAQAALATFLAGPVQDYPTERELPAMPGTSRLSPHLAHGELSPRQIWHAVRSQEPTAGTESWLRQVLWREFAWHLLAAYPHTLEAPLRPAYAAFPWRHDPEALAAWQQGRTGYPLVDAGMQELWATGWMHNRVRMVAASFLVKHLLVPWAAGARWFEDTLVDADRACNALGWQWVAGSGADAAPFFRIFNPATQAARHDPTGAYRERWRGAGAAPEPWIAHDVARARALAALEQMKRAQRT